MILSKIINKIRKSNFDWKLDKSLFFDNNLINDINLSEFLMALDSEYRLITKDKIENKLTDLVNFNVVITNDLLMDMIANNLKHPGFFDLLVKKFKIDINKLRYNEDFSCDSLLSESLRCSNDNIAHYLIKEGANIDNKIINCIFNWNLLDSFNLIKDKIDVNTINGNKCFISALNNDNKEMMMFVINKTNLDINVIESLIEKEKYKIAIQYKIKTDYKEIFEYLKLNSNINKENTIKSKTNKI